MNGAGEGGIGFDVVICTNRFTRYLPLAVASVANQTYTDWNLTVIDDGSDSPDEIDRVVEGLPRARVIHQDNRGLPAARNAAVRATTANVVTFLDEDDLWPAGRLESQALLLQRRPGSCAVFGDGEYIDSEGRVFGSWVTPEGSREEFLGGRVPLPRITTLAIRREAFARTGLFDESFSMAEDIEYILRLVRVGGLSGTATSLVQYRRHDLNMTNASPDSLRAGARRAVQQNIALAEAQDAARDVALLREYLRREDRRWAADSASRVIHLLKQGGARRAAADAVSSLRLAPLDFLSGALRAVGARASSRLARAPRQERT
ncbi:glycosyltransferase family 2 protein [Microbacterium rhizophilus]|uniref:glycosyltransferase family 2 protein n=1 Tax=Microbacterium rhizophilus TaxID=3138934 RepID=UPI0031E7721F